jgi:mannosyltransferase OCH1-like enzyme
VIPKVIYYVWLGKDPKNKLADVCILNYKLHNPDFDVVEINEDVFDFKRALEENKFLRECEKRGLKAFVSDYVRIKYLYENGGFYCDTDIQLLQSLKPYLKHSCVLFAVYPNLVEPAFFGCEPKHPLLKKVLDFYDNRILDSNMYIVPEIFTSVVQEFCGFTGIAYDKNHLCIDRKVKDVCALDKYGIATFNAMQDKWESKDKRVTVFSPKYMPNYSQHLQFMGTEAVGKKAIGIHWNSGSWYSDKKQKKRLNYLYIKHLPFYKQNILYRALLKLFITLLPSQNLRYRLKIENGFKMTRQFTFDKNLKIKVMGAE